MSDDGGSRRQYSKTPARRAEIIAAAFEIFASEGYEGTSMRSVAARVGISHMGLMHHFPTKEALLSAVIDKHEEDERQQLIAETTEVSIAGFLSSLVKVLERRQKTPQLMRLWVNVSASATRPTNPAHHDIARRYATVRGHVVATLESLQAAGELDAGTDCHSVAVAVLCLLDGLQVQWLLDPTTDVDRVLTAFLDPYRTASSQPALDAAVTPRP